MSDTTLAPNPSLPGDVLDVPENFPYFYQAVGTVQGVFLTKPFCLQTHDATLPLFVPKRLQERLSTGQEATLGVYPAWGETSFFFRVYSVKKSVTDAPSTPFKFQLGGCWRQMRQGKRLVVYRNPEAVVRSKSKPCPLALPLLWPDAPPAEGLFWRLEAHLVEGALVVYHAQGPFPPPPKPRWKTDAKGAKNEVNPSPNQDTSKASVMASDH